MIRLFFILITLFAVERVVSKRINTYKIKKVKTLIHQINNQYKYLFKGKSEYINFYQWLILFISQAFVVYALVRYIAVSYTHLLGCVVVGYTLLLGSIKKVKEQYAEMEVEI